MLRLLSRDAFRKSVFERDNFRCVFCSESAVDAHHVMERRLFMDGGYYIDNGVAVCEHHHKACEATDISVEEARAAAGISTIVLPDGFDPSLSYDKWGNEVLASGHRRAGPLFHRASVQDCIAKYLPIFAGNPMTHEIIKYPRTAHVVGSKLQPGDSFEGQVAIASLNAGTLIVEEKLDGGNCGISFNSDLEMVLQSRGHVLLGGPREAQFDLFKAWANCHQDALFDVLGDRYIMYGEWLLAKHTVFYDRLPHYFLEFDIFDKVEGVFLDTDTRHRMLYGSPVVSVPVVHRGPLKNEKEMRALVRPSLFKSDDWATTLGRVAAKAGVLPDQVTRETSMSPLAEGLYFKVEKDGRTIGRYKFVRPDFLQTILESGSHWADRTIVPNQLKDGVDIFA